MLTLRFVSRMWPDIFPVDLFFFFFSFFLFLPVKHHVVVLKLLQKFSAALLFPYEL